MSISKSKNAKHTQNWQKVRNYHRIYDQDGQVVANIITVDGVDVEVTEEVFLVYSQMDRRERYLLEEIAAGRILSLEQMIEDKVLSQYVGADVIPDVADIYLEQEENQRLSLTLRQLPNAIASLDASERHLIDALYIKGIPMREYARATGISHVAIIKRKQRTIKKLKKFLLK